MDFWNSIYTGVISGIIASICFTIFLLLIKPKVKISDHICEESLEEGKNIYRIKIVNKTFSMLTNIRYSLLYCQMHGDGISTVTEIPPRKTPIISIDKYTINRNKTDYAIRVTYDLSKYPLEENSKYQYVFMADHALSNTTTCVKKEFYKDDVINGVFESGKSTKILRTNKYSATQSIDVATQ